MDRNRVYISTNEWSSCTMSELYCYSLEYFSNTFLLYTSVSCRKKHKSRNAKMTCIFGSVPWSGTHPLIVYLRVPRKKAPDGAKRRKCWVDRIIKSDIHILKSLSANFWEREITVLEFVLAPVEIIRKMRFKKSKFFYYITGFSWATSCISEELGHA